MNAQEIATLRELMEYEASRTEPPEGFPALPDLPGGRYTDPRFFELEQAHIWRKSWLLAGHIDEIPEPGCFRLWERAGQPVVIVQQGHFNIFANRGDNLDKFWCEERAVQRRLATEDVRPRRKVIGFETVCGDHFDLQREPPTP